jgi:alkylation response protein AidB-like acyl-CoA dehydrogenase
VADYVFLLTRTDMEAPKRKNLTLFLVPSSAEGFSVSEVKTLGGERTNITTYRDVRVRDAMRIGEINGGWQVLTSALRFERFSTWGPALHRLVDTAAGAAASVRDEEGRPMLESVAVRARLARAAIDAEVSDLLALRAGWAGVNDPTAMVDGPVVKLFSTEAFAKDSSELLELFGPAGLRRSEGVASVSGVAIVEHDFRHSQVTTIYGGTSEVQRSIIAERGLGLPRSRALN